MGFFTPIRQLQNSSFLQPNVILTLDVLTSGAASAFTLLVINLILPNYNSSLHQFFLWLGCAFVVSFVVFRLGHIYRAIIRYSTFRELGRISIVCLGKELLLCMVLAACTQWRNTYQLILGIIIIDYFVTLSALSIIRISMITVYDYLRTKYKDEHTTISVLVYGTNDKSVSVISRLRNSPHYKIEGFITYGKKMRGQQLAGMDVYYFETLDDLKKNVQRAHVSGILFPYVADARTEQDRLVEYCKDIDIKTFILPSVDEISEGKTLSNYIRKIKIEDLLGRDEIKISLEEIKENFNNKVVLVTGAAGSIGSELCRQLTQFGVKRLVLFDNAETPLHSLRLELEDSYPDLDFVPVIGDVRSLNRLDFVFKNYRPQIVFHAAAYKHVPLMEENPCEAVAVNVTGSRQVADKCIEYNVEKMIMISTDKAVNPTNIMGCTKRLAEIYVQSLGLSIERGEIRGVTKFVTTRFGNVLGSNGSVIPRFREQIEHGGPVTVTHPDITRFFMTIPEACRLVMEAATFATGTQIFVFDMGKSVKIKSLAERMIRLAGLEVGRDIKIEFTGLRPGEKLFEEVLATKENTLPTCHERIYIAKAREYPYTDASVIMDHLSTLATAVAIPDMVKLMKQTVPEFISKNSEFEKYDIKD